jgi:predicted transcriptional regulator
MLDKKLNLKTDTKISSPNSDLEQWRHKQILEGMAESENKDYADDESVKQIFKKYQSR